MAAACPIPDKRSNIVSESQSPSFVQISPARAYKPSRFNAHVLDEEDGTLLIFNSFTGQFAAAPAKSRAKVEQHLSGLGTKGPLDETGRYLLNKGYIVPADADEGARWDARYGFQQFRTDIAEIHLLPTEDCNFRCIYCSHAFKRGVMPPEIRTGILAYITKRIKSLEALHIVWFGGEPLTGLEVIDELAPKIQALAQTHGVAYGSAMTTNAYLLTPDVAQRLVSWGVTQYQITVDGQASQHDKHRPLKDSSEGTYARI